MSGLNFRLLLQGVFVCVCVEERWGVAETSIQSLKGHRLRLYAHIKQKSLCQGSNVSKQTMTGKYPGSTFLITSHIPVMKREENECFHESFTSFFLFSFFILSSHTHTTHIDIQQLSLSKRKRKKRDYIPVCESYKTRRYTT